MKTFKDVDEYINIFLSEGQESLKEMRSVITKLLVVPGESISYEMPAYNINGRPLLYFASFKNHIGFYALPSAHAEFYKGLAKYKKGKGSVQFPLAERLPLELISKIVKFRVTKIL
ncbi:MAG: hypothetical protein AUJ98_01325 [Bacteroidetes bacterium CG2_30_33_31]|nr:MAG: hypothetical protein AUJ98_01325 [Bacteroidetes bacterium CG2_30_33_31]